MKDGESEMQTVKTCENLKTCENVIQWDGHGQRNAQVRCKKCDAGKVVGTKQKERKERCKSIQGAVCHVAAPRTGESDDSGQDAQSEADSNAPQAGIAVFCEFLSEAELWLVETR